MQFCFVLENGFLFCFCCANLWLNKSLTVSNFVQHILLHRGLFTCKEKRSEQIMKWTLEKIFNEFSATWKYFSYSVGATYSR